MCLYNYRNDLHFHWSGFNGWHSELCQSLQRHLRVLGVRLPDGPDLSDTSLLLGRYQSELPGEQLCLGRARFLHGWKNKTLLFSFFFFFFFFFSFCSDLQPVMFSGVEHLQQCVEEMLCVCVCVFEDVYMLEMYPVVFASGMVFNPLNKPYCMPINPPAGPQRLKSRSCFCQNPPSYKKTVIFFFLFFLLMNAKMSWLLC